MNYSHECALIVSLCKENHIYHQARARIIDNMETIPEFSQWFETTFAWKRTQLFQCLLIYWKKHPVQPFTSNN